ncbi:TonB system transport protein ExbD [Terrarubrum flagellatum]|uniref:TonB system transport protein ExbD n=1 Tax=Terrirubrum flagellatum TaxID=2895980 RepID=UPI003144DFD8
MAGRVRDSDELVENSEINVTPFIDVMLVLLIIFMVAAPLSTVDAPVELPVSTAKPQPRPEKPVFLTLKSDLTILVGEKETSFERLASAIDIETRADREQRLFVRGDQTVPYGEIVRLMNMLREAGYIKIALVGLDGGGSKLSPTPAPSASTAPAQGASPPAASAPSP